MRSRSWNTAHAGPPLVGDVLLGRVDVEVAQAEAGEVELVGDRRRPEDRVVAVADVHPGVEGVDRRGAARRPRSGPRPRGCRSRPGRGTPRRSGRCARRRRRPPRDPSTQSRGHHRVGRSYRRSSGRAALAHGPQVSAVDGERDCLAPADRHGTRRARGGGEDGGDRLRRVAEPEEAVAAVADQHECAVGRDVRRRRAGTLIEPPDDPSPPVAARCGRRRAAGRGAGGRRRRSRRRSTSLRRGSRRRTPGRP